MFVFVFIFLFSFCWFVLPFTEVLQEIRRDITREVCIFCRDLPSRHRGTTAWQAPDRLEQKGRKRTGYYLADTNFTNSHQLISLLVIIRAIRVFTAAFPRRVFGKQDRYAKGPRTDRA